MQGNEFSLHIGACPHLGGASHQDANRTAAHLSEQFSFFRFCVGIVNELNLFRRNTFCG